MTKSGSQKEGEAKLGGRSGGEAAKHKKSSEEVEEESGEQKIRERWAWKEKVSLTLTSTVHDANRR